MSLTADHGDADDGDADSDEGSDSARILESWRSRAWFGRMVFPSALATHPADPSLTFEAWRNRAFEAFAAVALASMAAKYVRELFMEALNSFFAERRADLRRTAGYAVDGRRFLAEIQPVLEELAIESDIFVRSR